MHTNVAMRTIAYAVSLIVLSLLLILLGAASIAAMVAWPPLGVGALAAGAGARLLHSAHTDL